MADSRYNPNDDDIDAFMASLIHEEPVQDRSSKPKRRLRASVSEPSHHTVTSEKQPASIPKPKKSRSSRRVVRLTLPIVSVSVVVVIGIMLLQGPISGLLQPESPFSAELQQNMGIKLYYPTKLPGSFKIERDSITQPETDVIMYAISDDSGKRINLTLQKKPQDISLDPLYAVLIDVHDINTQFGTIKVGNSQENTTTIANILTETTWIIVNGSKDTLDDGLLISLINELTDKG